jgi:hypothetical protein
VPSRNRPLQPLSNKPRSGRRDSGFGLFTGVMVYSTAFRGLFALVFAVADRRVADLGPRAVSALLAASRFIAVYVVPN